MADDQKTKKIHWRVIKKDGLPPEGSFNCVVFHEGDGVVETNIFYEAEHAAHDHSPWQTATHWMIRAEFNEWVHQKLLEEAGAG